MRKNIKKKSTNVHALHIINIGHNMTRRGGHRISARWGWDVLGTKLSSGIRKSKGKESKFKKKNKT